MQRSALDFIVCPTSHEPMNLTVFASESDEIIEGLLSCPATDQHFAIVEGIPRFVSRGVFSDPVFEQKHGIQNYGLKSNKAPEEIVNLGTEQKIEELQQQTNDMFGYQWEHFNDYGWKDQAFDAEASFKAFSDKLFLTQKEVAGKLVLDAGCGNGRYSQVVCEFGGTPVAIDLGHNVNAAKKNLERLGKPFHVFQADIFNLPFRDDAFDVIFSLGVIQHTGDGRLAFFKLYEKLVKRGLIAIRSYHRGNDILEKMDAMLRQVTTRFTPQELHQFSRILHDLYCFAEEKKFSIRLSHFINLFETHQSIFDWYAAPIAEKFTYSEVKAWFGEVGCHVLKDHDMHIPCAELPFHPISILGQKPASGGTAE